MGPEFPTIKVIAVQTQICYTEECLSSAPYVACPLYVCLVIS